MSSKLTYLSIVLIMAFGSIFAQTPGIAIQGIARDVNNTAKGNQDVSFVFTFYKGGDTSIEYLENTVTLKTDNFGIFSYVIPIGSIEQTIFANNEVGLKIVADNIEISNDAFQYVPYAIAASNGVPTGSIMPFLGAKDQVPDGWLLCNGGDIPDTREGEKLI
jgi:hypothetical protein